MKLLIGLLALGMLGNTGGGVCDMIQGAAESQAQTVLNGACGTHLLWNFEQESGLLEITGTGEMSFGGETDAPWSGLNRRIRSVSLPNALTGICTNAFADITALESVSVPDGVTEIGDCAFYGCTKLAQITVPESVVRAGSEILGETAWFAAQPDGIVYLGKLALGWHGEMPAGTEAEIRQGTAVLASGLFFAAENLISCTLPEGIAEIPEDCFSLCSNLKQLSLPDSVRRVACDFRKTALPADADGVCYAGKWAVRCDNPKGEIVLRPDTKGIAAYAFSYTPDIISVKMPDGMLYVGDLAFTACGAEVLRFPDSVQEMGAGVCYSSKKLREVRLPDSLTALKDIPLPKESGSLTCGLGFFRGCVSLQKVILPAGLTEIGESAFFHCESLCEIEIPAGVRSVGHSAFCWCKKLRRVTILHPDCEIYDGATTICDAVSLTNPNYYIFTGTVCGYAGSPAERFAEKYGMTFEPLPAEDAVLRGDVSGDGAVGAEDAQLCLQAYCRVLTNLPHGLNTAQFLAADADSSGTLTVEDAAYILRYYTVKTLASRPVTWAEILNPSGA